MVAMIITPRMMARPMLEVRFCWLMICSWAAARALAAFSPAAAAALSLGVQSLTSMPTAPSRSLIAMAAMSLASSSQSLMALEKAFRVLLSLRGKMLSSSANLASSSASFSVAVVTLPVLPERTASRRLRAAML